MHVSIPPSNLIDFVMLTDVGEHSCYDEVISTNDHAKC